MKTCFSEVIKGLNFLFDLALHTQLQNKNTRILQQ